MNWKSKLCTSLIICQALSLSVAWADSSLLGDLGNPYANSPSNGPAPQGPPPPSASSLTAGGAQVLSLNQAKSLIPGFGEVVDKKAKMADLNGKINNTCISHLRVAAVPQGSDQSLFEFAVIDQDGQGIACLTRTKSQNCGKNGSACTALSALFYNTNTHDQFQTRVPVAGGVLGKAHTGYRSDFNIASLQGTEAIGPCNCDGQLPGATSLTTLTKLNTDLDLDSLSDKRKEAHEKYLNPDEEKPLSAELDAAVASSNSSNNSQQITSAMLNQMLYMAMMQGYNMGRGGMNGSNGMNMTGMNGMNGMNNMNGMSSMNSYPYGYSQNGGGLNSSIYGANGMNINYAGGVSNNLYGANSIYNTNALASAGYYSNNPMLQRMTYMNTLPYAGGYQTGYNTGYNTGAVAGGVTNGLYGNYGSSLLNNNLMYSTGVSGGTTLFRATR